MKRLILFLLFASVFASAQTTTFIANLKDLATNTPANPEAGPVFLELTLRNIGSAATPTLCRVNGVGLVSFPVNLYPVSGLISQPVYDETFISCGGSTGVSYYHIRMYQGDSTRSAIKKLLFEDDFDVEGATFNLNSAAPRSAAVITPPPATAVLTNPSGNQTVVQPGSTALTVNRLSAGFAQSSNGTDMVPGQRFTDTSPTGNFLNFKNAAGSTSLWEVDITGTLLAGIIPNARLSTPPATGTGTTNKITKFTNGPSGAIGDSGLSDNGTTISTSEAVSLTGTLTALNLNGRCEALGQTGADEGAKIAACIVALGSSGGVVDARGITGVQTSVANPFASQTGPISLLLGPVTITTGATWAPQSNLGTTMTGIDSTQTVLKASTNLNAPVIDVNGFNNFYINNMTVDGNMANQSLTTGLVDGIHVKNSSVFRCLNVTVQNTAAHGYFFETGFSDVDFTNCSGNASINGTELLIGNGAGTSGSRITITKGHFDNSAGRNGVFSTGVITDLKIIGVSGTDDGDTCVEIGDGTIGYQVVGVNCTLWNSGSTGILLRSSQDGTISGNSIKTQNFSIQSASLTSNVATVVVAASPQHPFSTGSVVTFSGMTGAVSGLNGTFTLSAVTATSLSFNLVNANISSTSTAGTAIGANMVGIYHWNSGGDSQPFGPIATSGNKVCGLTGSGSSDIAWSSNSASSDNLGVAGNVTCPSDTKRYDARTANIAHLTVYGDDGTMIHTGGVAPTGQAGKGYLYYEAASNRWKVNMNNGGAKQLVISGADISASDTISALQGTAFTGTTGGASSSVMLSNGPTFSNSVTFQNVAIWGTSQLRLGSNQAFSIATATDGSANSADIFLCRSAANTMAVGTTNCGTDGKFRAGAYLATNLLFSATAPTISSGFGTSPSVTVNNGTADFRINIGTGGTATSGVIGLPTATTGWDCTCDDRTTFSTTVFKCRQTADTTTTATIGNFNSSTTAAAWAASDVLAVSCLAR